MEATWDPVDLPDPDTYKWKNIMYQYHNYLYDDYDNSQGRQISNMKTKLNAIAKADYNVPSLMGEFNYFNNNDAWDEGLKLLNDSGISWTMWTYKTTAKNGNWGLYHNSSRLRPVNIETASYDEIYDAWSNVGSDECNAALCNVVYKYATGDMSGNVLKPVEVVRTSGPSGYDHFEGSTAQFKADKSGEYLVVLTYKDGSSELYRQDFDKGQIDLSGRTLSGRTDIKSMDISVSPVSYVDGALVLQGEDFYTTGGLESTGFYSGDWGVGSLNTSVTMDTINDDWSNMKYVNFTIYAEEAGEYRVKWAYNGDGKDGMKACYRVNDDDNQLIILDNGGNPWDKMNSTEFTVSLNKGFNTLLLSGTIEIQSNWANIDYIAVAKQ